MKKITYMLMLLIAAGAAQAALEADWSSTNVTTVSDAAGDNTGGSAVDLLGVSHVYENNAHYFRLRTAAAPNQSSYGDYMLHFDWTAGGINAADSYYVATGFTGEDFLLDAHYFQENLASNHYHPINLAEASQFDTLLMSSYGVEYRTEMDGTDFLQEWKVPYSFLTGTIGMNYGDEVTLSVGTMYVHPTVGATFDTASDLQFDAVPEPATVALFGIAAFMGLAFRRVRSYFEM